MPPKRNKRYTQKEKKRTGRKQKNTTFKKGGASKTLAEIVKDKLEANDYKLIQQLIDNPDIKYSILIDFCKDNKLVVNTEAFLLSSFIPPDKGYEVYKNQLTIPDDFEKGKLLEIIIYANKDGIQYNTVVNDSKYNLQNCKSEKLPVIYRVPKITAPENIVSPVEMSSVIDENSLEKESEDNIFHDSIPYEDDLGSPDDLIEQVSMDDLQEKDLEDATEITPRGVSTPTDVSKELKAKIKEEELEAKIKKEELKGVSENPELKKFKDDLSLLKKKSQDKVLRSREEGDVDTSDMKTDFKELARERKEEKAKAKKQQEEIDKLAHEARLLEEKKDKNYLKNTQMKLKSYQVYCNQ